MFERPRIAAPYVTRENQPVVNPWARAVLTKNHLFIHGWSAFLSHDQTKDILYKHIAKQGVKLVDLVRQEKDGKRLIHVYPVPSHQLADRDRQRLISWADTCGYAHIGLDNQDQPLRLSGKVNFPPDAMTKCQACQWQCPYNAPYLQAWVEKYGRLPYICHVCASTNLPQWEEPQAKKSTLRGMTHRSKRIPTG